jgi:hypothetical protein
MRQPHLSKQLRKEQRVSALSLQPPTARPTLATTLERHLGYFKTSYSLGNCATISSIAGSRGDLDILMPLDSVRAELTERRFAANF